jgi:hypothetical protein
MTYNLHSDLTNKHALLAPSQPAWLNYSPEKLEERYYNSKAAERGTQLHNFAKQAIVLGEKLPKSKRTLNQYINDAIGYGMTPEQCLFYSYNCFGTADAILFKNGLLRIHDLKTGANQAHFEQLLVYAALFCLEYKESPFKIKIELRIYQNDEVDILIPDAQAVQDVMDIIVSHDKYLEEIKRAG